MLEGGKIAIILTSQSPDADEVWKNRRSIEEAQNREREREKEEESKGPAIARCVYR